jgi:cell filamentation protein
MDPYVYRGTNVLKNLRDIRDAALLNEFEAEASSRRLRQLEHEPVTGGFDTRHLQAIHKHIFQDVYQWAGEFRAVNIGKAGDLFALKEHIVSCLDKTFAELRQERHLRGAGLDRFALRGSHYLGEINAVHPFREGNGRTQREFIRQLAVRNGYELDWSRVSKEQMIEASKRSFRRDDLVLEQVLRSALDQSEPRP